MKITIDRTGRMVLPKAVRERFHLTPGSQLDLEIEADGVKLIARREGPSLVEKNGVLIHHGPEIGKVDIVDFLARERGARGRELAGI